MANTVYGPYVQTLWTNGTTPLNATNLGNLETQAADALNGFNPDLLNGGFVLSGVTCTKDGTVLNQLDVAAGRAYPIMSDGTIGLIVVGATTFTTSTPSTTYYLFLLNNGTWQWGTTSTGPTHSLAICQATTDASGNILAVTDRRSLNALLLSGLSGVLGLPPLRSIGGQLATGSFGAPVIVAQAVNVSVTATSQQTILSYTPTANGLYRVSAFYTFSNTGATQNLTIKVNYTDPNAGSPTFFFSDGSIVYNAHAMGGPATSSLALLPVIIYASTSAAITCQTIDSANSPTDHATFLIERLA